MEKPQEKRGRNHVAVHLRLDAELVAWMDQEGRRQRRPRAYVIMQALQMMKAVRQEWEKGEAP